MNNNGLGKLKNTIKINIPSTKGRWREDINKLWSKHLHFLTVLDQTEIKYVNTHRKTIAKMTSKEIELIRGRIYRELSFFNKENKKKRSSMVQIHNEINSSSTQESDSPKTLYQTFRRKDGLVMQESKEENLFKFKI